MTKTQLQGVGQNKLPKWANPACQSQAFGRPASLHQIESFLGHFNEGVESICEFFTDYTLSNDKVGVPIAIAVMV